MSSLPHIDDAGAGGAYEPATSWMDQYSTDVLKDDDFGLGFVVGFGACFTLACIAVGVWIGVS
jgi:hypothetical protein